MTDKKLPKRQEVPARYKWDLKNIYQDDTTWEHDFETIKQQLTKITVFKGKLGDSARNLLACLQLRDDLGKIADRWFVYAQMKKDEDNTVAKYQAMKDRAQSLMVEVSSQLSFIEPEILSIEPAKLESFFQQEPGLNLYKFLIEEITRMRPHTLSTAEEEIIAMSGEIGMAPKNIFGMLNNADIKFPEITDEDGDLVQLTHGRYLQFLESGNRQVRQDAFTGLYNTYKSQRNTLGALLNASIKKDIFYARVRKYASALEASLDEDKVPIQVYDNLISTVREHLPLFYRYIELRKKMLGLTELHMYDLYTPLVKEVKTKIPYEQAKKLMEEGLQPLGGQYLEDLKAGLASGWVDVMENEGKTPGAYSWGAYGTFPYILLNYQNDLHNVFTLAHELGHSMHSYYSWQSQPYPYAYYKIFVAEVASTVNETLLTRYLLANAADRNQKMYIINHYLEQFRGTVFRQTMFAEFEKITHQQAEAGESLTADRLSEIYYDLNKVYYGPGMVIDEDIAMEWARIPHFYNAFYVYKYATGFSAATALSSAIRQEGAPAVERYLEFLKSGGSDYPINLLTRAGVDMNDPKPIKEALQVFEEMLGEMEQLAAKM